MPTTILNRLADYPGPHTDCSFDGGGRFPRAFDKDPNWATRPCAWISFGSHRVVFNPPRPLGEVVLEAEATGRVFWNDTPQVEGRRRNPIPGPAWRNRVFAARLPDGSPHALAWWYDGLSAYVQIPHDQVIWDK